MTETDTEGETERMKMEVCLLPPPQNVASPVTASHSDLPKMMFLVTVRKKRWNMKYAGTSNQLHHL